MRPLRCGVLLLSFSAMVWMAGCGDHSIAGQFSNPGTGNPIPSKSNPVITWQTPAAIVNPAPLGAAQLDATANVPGTFAYTPATGAVLAPGNQTLSTTFTPTDTADYNTVTAAVTLTVDPPVVTTVQVGSGHLAIADSGNNRVLFYTGPFSTNQAATMVLGQPDFTHSQPNQGGHAAANTLSYPSGLAMDASGNLWVVDPGNCRVLEFQPPFTTNEAASIVLGQPNMTTSPAGTNSLCLANFDQAAAGMLTPSSLTFDSAGDLWVLDILGNRITEYLPPFTNGEAAAVSIGQSSVNYVYGCEGRGGPEGIYNGVPAPPSAATSLCLPEEMTFDVHGNLWVSNYQGNFVMEFAPPFTTGMAASLEMGGWGSPIVSCDAPATGTFFCGPWGLAFDASGNLWITDVSDNRALEFTPPFQQGMNASLVLGQATLNSYGPGMNPTASSVMGEGPLLFDKSGNLIMTEWNENRVRFFAPPFSNDMNAIVVLGQVDMNSNGANQGSSINDPTAPAANTLFQPNSVLAW